MSTSRSCSLKSIATQPLVIDFTAIHALFVPLTTHHIFVLGSGHQLSDIVEKLRRQLFDVWVKTNDQGVIMYRSRPIEECPDWTPGSYWSSWKILGPPAGDGASALLGDLSAEPKPFGDDKMPTAINTLLNDRFTSRQDQRNLQTKAAAAAITCVKVESSVSSTPIKNQTRPRDAIKLFDAHTRERDQRILRLEKLLSIRGLSASDHTKYSQELQSVLEEPVVSLQSCLIQIDEVQSPRSDYSMSFSSPISASKLTLRTDSDSTLCLSEFVQVPTIVDSTPSLDQSATLESFLCKTNENHHALTVAYAQRTCDDEHIKHSLDKSSYCDLLESSEKLCIVPSNPNGACLFESVLHSIKEIFYSDSVWADEAVLQVNWPELTVVDFRLASLLMMKNLQNIPFEALSIHGYKTFSDMILDEGHKHGIMDHECRNSGEPPKTFESTSTYFELMKSPSAYGNLSALLGISILCKVTVNVWIAPSNVPEVYNPGQRHSIHLMKTDRNSHFDALSKSAKLFYLRHGEPDGDRTYKYSIDNCPVHGGSGISRFCCFCSNYFGHEYFENGTIHNFDDRPDDVPILRTPYGATDSEDALRQKYEPATISPGLHINHALRAAFKEKRVALSKKHDSDQAKLDDEFDANILSGKFSFNEEFEFEWAKLAEKASISAMSGKTVPETLPPCSQANSTSASKAKSAIKNVDDLGTSSSKIAQSFVRHTKLMKMLAKKDVRSNTFHYSYVHAIDIHVRSTFRLQMQANRDVGSFV